MSFCVNDIELVFSVIKYAPEVKSSKEKFVNNNAIRFMIKNLSLFNAANININLKQDTFREKNAHICIFSHTTYII